MNDDPTPPTTDEQLEREIRAGRSFSLAEAIGRLAGPGAIKGASPIARDRQAEAALDDLLRQHLDDSAGALSRVLRRELAARPDIQARPATALATHLRTVLATEERLRDLVRDADVEWGRMMGERPYFETDGRAPDPDDPYTHAAVRTCLERLLARLPADG